MKKILTLVTVLYSVTIFSQNIFFDNFSSANLTKIDGQLGYSSATPSLGNGTGACAGISCIPVAVVAKTMNFTNFTSCSQAINPVDGTLATGDGPGKSFGAAITSGSLYVALLVNFSTPSSGTSPTASKQVVRLMDNSFTVAGRIYIKQLTGGGFQVGIDKNGSATSFSSSGYSYGQEHLLILKYKFNVNANDDIVSVFVDPDLSLGEPSPTISLASGTDATTITRLVFPWNVSSFVPNGYIGAVSASKDWNNIIPQAITTFSIKGRTINAKKEMVQTSKIFLKNPSSKDSTNTAVDGSYAFTSLVASVDYTLKPTKNNDITKANGINTSDVLLLQRHILNTTKITNPYKLIAADVNGDKIINSTDLLKIKRLILGTDITFTKGSGANKIDRLWEFIDSAYVFPDTTNPFPFKDSINFTNLTSSKINQTFISVKLGDVSSDWNPGVLKGVNIKPVVLAYKTSNKELGIGNSIVKIPITSNNFKELIAIQYTLHFNNKEYEFVGIENNKLDIDFNDKQANANGNISFLWTDKTANEKTIADGTELFVLVLKQKGIGNLELGMSDAITEVSAWDKDFNQHNIILTKREIIEEQPATINEINIFPNPANGQVNIGSINAKQIAIIDIMGRTIKQFNNTLKHQTISIAKLPRGVYHVQAIMNDGSISNKKLVVE